MKRLIYVGLLLLLVAVPVLAQEDVDFIQDTAGAAQELSVTSIFELEYVKHSEIVDQIRNELTDFGTLKLEDDNSVVVTDLMSNMESIKKLVASLDKVERKIIVEAKVVQIILNEEHPRGVDWSATVSDYQVVPYKDDKLQLGKVSLEETEMLFEALDTLGLVNELSSSHVITQKQEQARISIGTVEPYVITMTSNEPYAFVWSKRLGGRDDFMRLYFAPSVGEGEGTSVKIRPEGGKETEFLTEEGDTIVIGGLMKEERVERLRKIPVLGDLPILGFAFRNPNPSMKKTEFVIFVNTRIVE